MSGDGLREAVEDAMPPCRYGCDITPLLAAVEQRVANARAEGEAARMVELVEKWHPKSGGTCGSSHHRSLTSWPCSHVTLVRNLAAKLAEAHP